MFHMCRRADREGKRALSGNVCEACAQTDAPVRRESLVGPGNVVICFRCQRDWNEYLRLNYAILLATYMIQRGEVDRLRGGWIDPAGMSGSSIMVDALLMSMDTEQQFLEIWRSWTRTRREPG